MQTAYELLQSCKILRWIGRLSFRRSLPTLALCGSNTGSPFQLKTRYSALARTSKLGTPGKLRRCELCALGWSAVWTWERHLIHEAGSSLQLGYVRGFLRTKKNSEEVNSGYSSQTNGSYIYVQNIKKLSLVVKSSNECLVEFLDLAFFLVSCVLRLWKS